MLGHSTNSFSEKGFVTFIGFIFLSVLNANLEFKKTCTLKVDMFMYQCILSLVLSLYAEILFKTITQYMKY